MIRHCLLEHKQNIANAFNIIGVSSDFTLEEGGGLMGGGIFTDSCTLAIIMFVYAKLLAWFKKNNNNKSLKSAANLNNSPNEEFCSSVKKNFSSEY